MSVDYSKSVTDNNTPSHVHKSNDDIGGCMLVIMVVVIGGLLFFNEPERTGIQHWIVWVLSCGYTKCAGPPS